MKEWAVMLIIYVAGNMGKKSKKKSHVAGKDTSTQKGVQKNRKKRRQVQAAQANKFKLGRNLYGKDTESIIKFHVTIMSRRIIFWIPSVSIDSRRKVSFSGQYILCEELQKMVHTAYSGT